MCESNYVIDPFWKEIIFAIGGMVGGAVCTYLGAVKIARRNKRLESGIALYETFREILRRLEKPENFDTQDILNSRFGHQMKAAEQFIFFLNGRTLKGFSTAWNEYKEKNNKQQYADQGVISEREPKRKTALEDIYKILKFTGYKR